MEIKFRKSDISCLKGPYLKKHPISTLSGAQMLSAFMSVKPLGNDFVNNIYSRGKWKDFNKCLVTDSNHPINETNPFFT